MGEGARSVAGWGVASGFALLAFCGASCGLETHGSLDPSSGTLDASAGGSGGHVDASAQDQTAPKGGAGSVGKGGASGGAGTLSTQGGATGAGGAAGSIAQGGATGQGGAAGSTGQGGATPNGGAAGQGGTAGTGGIAGTGGATGGAGGSIVAECKIGTGDATCDSCFATDCAISCGTCSTNPECTALVNCLYYNDCWDQYSDCWKEPCVTACRGAHAAGTTDYDAFIACWYGNCAAECGSGGPNCGGIAGSGGGPPCKPIGDSCNGPGECCNQYCCQSYSPGTCRKQNTESCGSDNECCTQHCHQGYCAYP